MSYLYIGTSIYISVHLLLYNLYLCIYINACIYLYLSYNTSVFMKTVPSVYNTLLIKTIYLSNSTQEVEGIVFRSETNGIVLRKKKFNCTFSKRRSSQFYEKFEKVMNNYRGFHEKGTLSDIIFAKNRIFLLTPSLIKGTVSLF